MVDLPVCIADLLPLVAGFLVVPLAFAKTNSARVRVLASRPKMLQLSKFHTWPPATQKFSSFSFQLFLFLLLEGFQSFLLHLEGRLPKRDTLR